MPIEDDGKGIDEKLLTQTPADAQPQVLGRQNLPSTTAGQTPKQNEPIAIGLEQDIKSGERWLICIAIATLIMNAVIALIYWGQLNEMRKSTDAATTASKTASDTLAQMKADSTSSTQQFATQLGKLDASITQAKRLAEATEKANENARDANRPWIGIESAIPSHYARQANGYRIMFVDFTLRNYGRSAAQHVQISPEMMIMSPNNRDVHLCTSSYPPQYDLGDLILPTEPFPARYGLTVAPSEIVKAIREHPQDRNIYFKVVGCVMYEDGDRKIHHTPFSYVLELESGRYITADTLLEEGSLKLTKIVVNPGEAN